MMRKIRVLVVDDQKMVRLSLCTFLRAFDDLEAIGDAANGQEAVARCAQTQPDVVLMDIKMPDMDGITAAGLIGQCSPSTVVILLSAVPLQEVMEAALRAGVRDYLHKNSSIEDIAAAIRRAVSDASA
jgi:two-component system, NarL family, response regulator LiaR